MGWRIVDINPPGSRLCEAAVIAKIVHEANLHDGKFTRQESTSVDLAIKGLAVATQDDHEPPRVGAMDTCYAVSSSLRRRHPPGDCPLK